MAKKFMPDTYTFVIAMALGLALGGILSLLFGRVALPTKIPFEFTIGGFGTGLILTNILIVVIVSAIVFLGYVAVVVQDNKFPSEHPFLFAIETAIVGLIPATVIFAMTGFRTSGKIELHTLNQEYLLLAAKFGIFHLLFQYSGIYSYFFPAA